MQLQGAPKWRTKSATAWGEYGDRPCGPTASMRGRPVPPRRHQSRPDRRPPTLPDRRPPGRHRSGRRRPLAGTGRPWHRHGHGCPGVSSALPSAATLLAVGRPAGSTPWPPWGPTRPPPPRIRLARSQELLWPPVTTKLPASPRRPDRRRPRRPAGLVAEVGDPAASAAARPTPPICMRGLAADAGTASGQTRSPTQFAARRSRCGRLTKPPACCGLGNLVEAGRLPAAAHHGSGSVRPAGVRWTGRGSGGSGRLEGRHGSTSPGRSPRPQEPCGQLPDRLASFSYRRTTVGGQTDGQSPAPNSARPSPYKALSPTPTPARGCCSRGCSLHRFLTCAMTASCSAAVQLHPECRGHLLG